MGKKLEYVRFLGGGSFGSVSLVNLQISDGISKESAMKLSTDYDVLNREIQILSKFKGCPRIIQAFDDVLDEIQPKNGSKLYRIFLEYAPLGTLNDYMDKHSNRRLSDHHIKEVTRMLLEGIVSIHSRNYIHCDLKPENILVFPFGVKISDFGLSREIDEEEDWWSPGSPFWATPDYMSPESVIEGRIGKALDVWSLGCIVLEMYTGERPWLDKNGAEIASDMKNGDAPEIPATLPWIARQFIETCLARNPEERGNALDLLSHPFLRREEFKPESKAHDRKPLRISSKPFKSKDIPKITLRLKIIRPKPFKSKDVPKIPLRLKITPPKPFKSKDVPKIPLRLKIIPPKPPASHNVDH